MRKEGAGVGEYDKPMLTAVFSQAAMETNKHLFIRQQSLKTIAKTNAHLSFQLAHVLSPFSLQFLCKYHTQ